MSTYGPTSCAQLRGTPPPIVKMPSFFAPRASFAKLFRSRKGL